MKNNCEKITAICVVMVIIFGCVVYAANMYEVSYTNKVMTGSTDIKVEQYEITENGEKLIDPGMVMPNMNVSYIPRVTNLRSEGYVRVKVDIVMEKDVPQPIVLDHVYGINDDWLRIGDYFYNTKKLVPGESSDIFEGFNIPEQWTNETASGFAIKLKADVVQTDFFEPDFSSALPWGCIEIENAKEEDNVTYGIARQIKASPEWTYTEVAGFETTTGNLFHNFDHFMAGDSFKDTLAMNNKASNDIKVYFKTDVMSADLLKQITLKILCNGNTVYEGDLESNEMDTYFYLTTIKSGGFQDFVFEVLLPEKSQNYYSVLKENVVWKFKVAEMSESVKTGDENNILPFIAASIIALLAFALLLIIRRKEDGSEDN